MADPSAGEARLTDKILKGFFSKPPCCTHEFPFLSICFFLSHTLIVFLSLSLSFSLFAIAPLSLSITLNLSVALSLSLFLQLHLTKVSVVLLLSICLVAKCLALSIGLDLSKPVDRRDESFQTDSVCPRVSFTLPEGKQNSVAPFRC